MTDQTVDELLSQLNVREKLAHIDQMLADIDRTRADHLRIIADHDRKRQEIRWYPAVIILSGMTTGAALFAAGAAFVKLMGG